MNDTIKAQQEQDILRDIDAAIAQQATKRPDGLCKIGDDPAIYVACLASYNQGILYGNWINLTVASTKEEIQECIDWILKHSPEPGAEEYAVHDTQCLCGPCEGTEWPDLEQLAELGSFYSWAALNDAEWIAYRMLCNDENEILSEDDFRERYCGVYESEADYAEEHYKEGLSREEIDQLDKAPFSYIDWQRVWEGELHCNGWTAAHIFEAGGYIITRPA